MNDYTIGVVGLGNMGLPIAENLTTGGFAVTAYDIDSTRRSPNVALDYCDNLSEIVAKTLRPRACCLVCLIMPPSLE